MVTGYERIMCIVVIRSDGKLCRRSSRSRCCETEVINIYMISGSSKHTCSGKIM